MVRGLPSISTVKTDLMAGMLCGVVYAPTAMAFGVIAGVGAAAGLYGAIAVGLLAAVLGGTRGAISAPNILTVLVLAPVVAEYGLATAFSTVILSGLLLIGFGLLKMGRFIIYMPHSLLSGFFTAAGIMLVAVQILPLFGMPSASGGILGVVKALPGVAVNFDALAVACITIVADYCGGGGWSDTHRGNSWG